MVLVDFHKIRQTKFLPKFKNQQSARLNFCQIKILGMPKLLPNFVRKAEIYFLLIISTQIFISLSIQAKIQISNTPN